MRLSELLGYEVPGCARVEYRIPGLWLGSTWLILGKVGNWVRRSVYRLRPHNPDTELLITHLVAPPLSRTLGLPGRRSNAGASVITNLCGAILRVCKRVGGAVGGQNLGLVNDVLLEQVAAL